MVSGFHWEQSEYSLVVCFDARFVEGIVAFWLALPFMKCCRNNDEPRMFFLELDVEIFGAQKGSLLFLNSTRVPE